MCHMYLTAGTSGYALDDKTALSSTPPVKPVRTNSGCYCLPQTNQKSCFEVHTYKGVGAYTIFPIFP